MEIDQTTAKQLLDNGAFVLLLDAPVGLSFGIDMNEWETGPRFKGLKLIPPGLHFVHYSSKSSSTGEVGVRAGFFRFFKSKEVFVTQWNAVDEELMDEQNLDPDHVYRLKYNILEFEPNLGAYPLLPHPQQPLPTYRKWIRLTNYISEPLLKQLLPNSSKVSSLVSVSRFSDLDREVVASHDYQAVDMEIVTDGASNNALGSINIKFADVDLKRSFPINATAQERTRYFLDKSYLCQKTLKDFYNSDYKLLLGELQFSFVLFLVGQVYDGLEQWKVLVQLLCASKELITSHRTLYFDFIVTLHTQLQECPEDFFVDALSSSNFLRTALVSLVCNLRDPNICNQRPDPKLEEAVTRFVGLVSERFQWDLEEAVREKWLVDEEEEGEFAPQLVE